MTVFEIGKVPFSRYGSIFSLSVGGGGGGRPAGLYLRVHAGNSPRAFRVEPVRDGQVLDYAVDVTPALLRLNVEGGGRIEVAIAGEDTIRFRGDGVSLRIEMPAERWTFAYRLPGGWAFNLAPHSVQLGLEVLRGDIDMEAPWAKGPGFCWETTHAIATIAPDEGGHWEAAIDDFLTTWVPPERMDFDLRPVRGPGVLRELQPEDRPGALLPLVHVDLERLPGLPGVFAEAGGMRLR